MSDTGYPIGIPGACFMKLQCRVLKGYKSNKNICQSIKILLLAIYLQVFLKRYHYSYKSHDFTNTFLFCLPWNQLGTSFKGIMILNNKREERHVVCFYIRNEKKECDKKKVTTYFLRCQALGLVNDKKDHSNVGGGVCAVDPLLVSV